MTSCWVAATLATTNMLPAGFTSHRQQGPSRDEFTICLFNRQWHHAFPASRSRLSPRSRKMSTAANNAFLLETKATGARTSSTSVGCQKACFCFVLSRYVARPASRAPQYKSTWRRGSHGTHVKDSKLAPRLVAPAAKLRRSIYQNVAALRAHRERQVPTPRVSSLVSVIGVVAYRAPLVPSSSDF